MVKLELNRIGERKRSYILELTISVVCAKGIGKKNSYLSSLLLNFLASYRSPARKWNDRLPSSVGSAVLFGPDHHAA
jgi:hypothetical protein